MLTNLRHRFHPNPPGLFLRAGKFSAPQSGELRRTADSSPDKNFRRTKKTSFFCPQDPESRRDLPADRTKGSFSPQAVHLRKLLAVHGKDHKMPVILCIGTDRIIGDCLGPLVGSRLIRTGLFPYVYGTLDAPVHALNLRETLDTIRKEHPASTIIAVDASLGSRSGIGSISVCRGGLHPGAGVSKNLGSAGDISITGITNMEDGCPWLSLQTARLSTVMRMADQIAECILEACTY